MFPQFFLNSSLKEESSPTALLVCYYTSLLECKRHYMLGIDFEIYLVQKQKQENKGPNYFFDKEHATLCKSCLQIHATNDDKRSKQF